LLETSGIQLKLCLEREDHEDASPLKLLSFI